MLNSSCWKCREAITGDKSIVYIAIGSAKWWLMRLSQTADQQ
jgi:hypothetical protein